MDGRPEYMDALFKMYPGKWCWSFPSGAMEYENMVWHDEEIPKPAKEEVAKVYEELLREHPWKELREERNRRLAEVDWVFSTDYQIEDTLYKEWLAYRRALRDLPSVTEDPTNPVWPEKPETPTGTTTSENVSLHTKVTNLEQKATSQELLLIELRKRVEKLEG